MRDVIYSANKQGCRVKVFGSLETPQVMLELPNGLSDWPIRYEDGRIAYDLTVPGYAKKLVEKAYKWLDHQCAQRDVAATLDKLLAGPISEGQLHNLTRHLDGPSRRQLSMWITIVDGICSVPNALVESLAAYINALRTNG